MKEGKIYKVMPNGFYIDNKDIFCYKNMLPDAKEGFKVRYELKINEDKRYPKQFIVTSIELIRESEANNSTPGLAKDDFVIDGFFSEDGTIHFHLISDLDDGKHKNVQEIGKLLSERGQGDAPLTITQLRKFYYKFQQIFEQNLDDNQKKISLLMLKANFEYSSKRMKVHRFARMMKNRIDIVVKSSDKEFKMNIEALNRNFEALVAYYPTAKSEN